MPICVSTPLLKPSSLILWQIVYGCFYATMVSLSSWTEIVWSMKPNILIVWLFQEKFADACCTVSQRNELEVHISYQSGFNQRNRTSGRYIVRGSCQEIGLKIVGLDRQVRNLPGRLSGRAGWNCQARTKAAVNIIISFFREASTLLIMPSNWLNQTIQIILDNFLHLKSTDYGFKSHLQNTFTATPRSVFHWTTGTVA